MRQRGECMKIVTIAENMNNELLIFDLCRFQQSVRNVDVIFDKLCTSHEILAVQEEVHQQQL